MRGLTILLVDAAPGRFAAALALAAAQAALGGRARLFCQGAAVTLLAEGTPLMGEALDLGVALLACQTGLAEAGLDLSALDARIVAAGPVSLLRELGEDRLVAM